MPETGNGNGTGNRTGSGDCEWDWEWEWTWYGEPADDVQRSLQVSPQSGIALRDDE
jgi:hypothetical protein